MKQTPKTAPPVIMPILAPDESDVVGSVSVLVPLLAFVHPL